MNPTQFSRATHFSIVWAFMLCFVTIVEWRSLDREPLKKDILSPFIQRDIKIVAQPGVELASGEPQYIVELGFNGTLFLACFFLPIIGFNGVGALWARFRAN